METPSTASLTLSQLIGETSRKIDQFGYLIRHPQLYVSERFYVIRNQIDIRVEELLLANKFAEDKEGKLNGRRDELLEALAAAERDSMKYIEVNQKALKAKYGERLKKFMTDYTNLTGSKIPGASRVASPALLNGRKSRSSSPRDVSSPKIQNDAFTSAFNGNDAQLRSQLLKLYDETNYDIYELKREICLDKSFVLNSAPTQSQSQYYFGRLVQIDSFLDEKELPFLR